MQKQHLSMGFSCNFPELEKWSLSDYPTWFSSHLKFLVGFCIYSLLMFYSVIAVCLHSRFDTYICKTLLIWLTCITTFPPCGAPPSWSVFFIFFACQFHIFGINKFLLFLELTVFSILELLDFWVKSILYEPFLFISLDIKYSHGFELGNLCWVWELIWIYFDPDK